MRESLVERKRQISFQIKMLFSCEKSVCFVFQVYRGGLKDLNIKAFAPKKGENIEMVANFLHENTCK